MIRRPPRSTLSSSSAASDVYKRQDSIEPGEKVLLVDDLLATGGTAEAGVKLIEKLGAVSYTHLRAHETKANLVCRLLLVKKIN